MTSALFGALHLTQNAFIWQSGVLIMLVGFVLGVVRHVPVPPTPPPSPTSHTILCLFSRFCCGNPLAKITFMIETIQWTSDGVVMIDQTRLPSEETYVTCRDYMEVADAIRTMVIRGAPAIGVAAAMGVALGVSEPTRQSLDTQVESSAPNSPPQGPRRSISSGPSIA